MKLSDQQADRRHPFTKSAENLSNLPGDRWYQARLGVHYQLDLRELERANVRSENFRSRPMDPRELKTRHSHLRFHGRRWWWWLAQSSTIFVLLVTVASFRWQLTWFPRHVDVGIHIGNGRLVGFNRIPYLVRSLADRSWAGKFVLEPADVVGAWTFLPTVSETSNGGWLFMVPFHFPLSVLLSVVVFPILPPVVRRRRLKAGLCVLCEYDLTGNESGTCPECGTPTNGT